MAARTLEKRLQPRKTPRQTRAAETRARILDAARQVFASFGYAAGTTNRIAEKAGMSVGSLYQYFPNKDAILVELVRAHVQDGTEQISAAVARHRSDTGAETHDADDLGELVRAVIGAMVAVHAQDRRLHRVLFEESPRPPSLLAELAALEDRIVELLAGLLRDRHPPADDPDLSARIIVVTIESLVHRLVATDRPLDTDRFIDEATRLVAGYLANIDESGGR
jgi:AcrR family transcriptional regulator